MKKIIILLSSFVVLGSFLVGCSNSDVTSTKETIVETEAKEIESIELTLENWEEYFELNDKYYVIYFDEFDDYEKTSVGMCIYLKDEYTERLTDSCNIKDIAFKIEADWIPTDVLVNEETFEVEFGETYPSLFIDHLENTMSLFDYREFDSDWISANPDTIRAEYVTTCYIAGIEDSILHCANIEVTKVKGTLELYK